MTILEAVKDPNLFLSLFRNLATWQAWQVWLKAVSALPLDPEELDLYRKCTGRQAPPSTEPQEVFTVVGRRGGKSFIAALVAVYLACFRDYSPFLATGERAVVMCLARDRNQARVIFGYIAGILRNIPLLAQMIETEKAEEIDLTNRVTIAVYTSSYKAIRGVTIAAALCDEIAFWQADGVNPDREILTALRPAMATIPTAKLLCLSTPYARAGVLYETYREHWGKSGSDTLVWQAPTVMMNPTIPSAFIAREQERDPEAARAEWGALFREDIESAFPSDVVEACIVPGRVELPPAGDVQYRAFADPSGGRSDAFTLSIGHRRRDGMVVIDCLRSWPPPFSPEAVVSECAALLKQYRLHRVTGDRYAGEWPREAFGRQGVLYEECQQAKSDLYLTFIPALTSKQVELPDDRTLLKELRQLERRRGRTGKDTIDHPTGAHDDIANVVAGVVTELLSCPVGEVVLPFRL